MRIFSLLNIPHDPEHYLQIDLHTHIIPCLAPLHWCVKYHSLSSDYIEVCVDKMKFSIPK